MWCLFRFDFNNHPKSCSTLAANAGLLELAVSPMGRLSLRRKAIVNLGGEGGYAGKGFPPWRRAGDPSKACSCSVHTHKLPADHSPACSYNDSYCPATTMETMSSPVRMLSDKILMYNNVVSEKKTDTFSLKT